jgi:tRNA(His) 5'-end guanylyltransferase
MRCGFNVLYGYTQSDEISLLFHRQEQAFGRKLRKFNSVLAGEASATFTLLLGSQTTAVFDCRISQFPTQEDVVDYFRWRQGDAFRNAVNGHSYWLLRRQGKSAHQATGQLKGLSVNQKHELLFQGGINVDALPAWQKRGVGLSWEPYTKAGYNPKTGEKTVALRYRISNMGIPMREEYSDFILSILRNS